MRAGNFLNQFGQNRFFVEPLNFAWDWRMLITKIHTTFVFYVIGWLRPKVFLSMCSGNFSDQFGKNWFSVRPLITKLEFSRFGVSSRVSRRVSSRVSSRVSRRFLPIYKRAASTPGSQDMVIRSVFGGDVCASKCMQIRISNWLVLLYHAKLCWIHSMQNFVEWSRVE